MSMESTQPSAGDEMVNGHATLPDRTKGVFGGGGCFIGYDFYDPFSFSTFRTGYHFSEGETDAKAGRILLHLVSRYINVKIGSE